VRKKEGNLEVENEGVCFERGKEGDGEESLRAFKERKFVPTGWLLCYVNMMPPFFFLEKKESEGF